MSFSRMEATMEDAFVEWINTFECKSNPIDTVVELADGIILSQVLADIDTKWFKQITPTETASNWVVRFNNQKKIHKLITRYFEEILGQDPEHLPPVNLSAIAKDADLHEILLVCQFVIAIAVQSDNNRIYIEMIQSLSQKSQHALMVSIEQVMSHFNDSEQPTSRLSHVSGVSHKSMEIHDLPYRYQAEFDRVLDEKKHYETSHTQLLAEYDGLRDRLNTVMDEKEDLKNRLRDMDEAIHQSNSTGKTDFLMRTEIEHLKQDLERSEDRRHEVDSQLEKHVSAIHELKRKVEELTTKAEEASGLREQLEEYRHTTERVQKMENTLEKYKRKVEEMSELKRQIKALEDQNTSLLERSHQVEDEYRKVLAFKTLMDSYKEQVHQLEMGNREILKEKTRLDTELRGLSETCTYLENDRDRAIEQVQLLEEHIKEMEFSGQPMDKILSHRASVVIDEGLDSEHNTMEENVKKSNITELRLTIARLQRQIKEMDDNKPTTLDQVKLTEFKAIEQAKKQLEVTFTTVLNERDQLRQELAQIRNGIPDSLLNQTQTIMAFRSRILDLEKESTFLRESTSQLETTVLEGTRSVAKDGTSLQQFEMEQTKIQDRLNRLEDITKMQLHDINRMLVEANYLNGVNNQPEEEFSRGRPGMSDKDLEIIKEENANLQIHVLHLQEEINETQGKIRKVRDMVKLYNQLFQEMTVRFGSANGRDENGGLLGRAPRTKEEEHDLLKKQIHDVRLQSRREQQLIISAWYDLARRHHRDTTSLSNRSTPSSWLGRQRKILDGQLRQRLC